MSLLKSFLMLIIFQRGGFWKPFIYSLAHLLPTIYPMRQLKLIDYSYRSGDGGQDQPLYFGFMSLSLQDPLIT